MLELPRIPRTRLLKIWKPARTSGNSLRSGCLSFFSHSNWKKECNFCNTSGNSLNVFPFFDGLQINKINELSQILGNNLMGHLCKPGSETIIFV